MHTLHLLACVIACLSTPASSQSRTPTLGLADGFITLDTPSFSVQLVKDSQTLASLKPKGSSSQTNNGTFDFAAFDQLVDRQYNGNYHVGDITFRARTAGSSAWISGDTTTARKTVAALPASGATLAAANLSPTLPTNSLLNITRRWTLQNSTLTLSFEVTNSQPSAVEIGSIGFPIEFNSIFTGRTAADTNINCSLTDPYIGNDAGFVQATPLLGTMPPLIVTPLAKTPFEAWRFLPEPTANTPFYQSQTFEGLYEWQTHTLAWAQNEWANVTPWNVPTSETLQPGQTRTYGLQFHLGSTIRDIDTTLHNAGRPVTVGIPGYILPSDQTGKLFLNYSSAVQSISVTPAGALTLTANSEGKNGFAGYTLVVPSSASGLPARVRVTITYADGTVQTVHYFVTQPSVKTISNLGNFLLQTQWFLNATDPFHRSPSILSYDRDVNAHVTDDDRAWIPGLSDEAGAGSWLAAAMKQYAQPNAAEVTRVEQFINQTLWGSVQLSNGSSVFGVRKSVYYYQPNLVPSYHYPTTEFNFGGSWNQAASFLLNRAYDYVHVSAAYWSLYRVARNYPSLVTRPWQWYINQALQTVLFTTRSSNNVGFSDDGLMGETVWRVLLDDLQREKVGLTANATALQSAMQARERIWSGEQFPFGSEMAWDSTGQEGVYMWAKYFNDTKTRVNALNSILAYQPTVPHWGWNGNARRYWDNLYGGKLRRIERQVHHYGSGLNALPLISEFQTSPTDWYLLRTGYGGLSGPLSNIDSGGFGAASFHSWPDTLKFDGYSGDYGPNFVGHTLNVGTYIIEHPDFGWQAFGGTVTASSSTVQVQIQDTLRRRIFVAPFGTLLTLDAGAFSMTTINPSAKTIQVTITPAAVGATNAASAPEGRLVITQTATISGITGFTPMTSFQKDGGAFVVPFTTGQAVVTLQTN